MLLAKNQTSNLRADEKQVQEANGRVETVLFVSTSLQDRVEKLAHSVQQGACTLA